VTIRYHYETGTVKRNVEPFKRSHFLAMGKAGENSEQEKFSKDFL
jgi:hypothetical protein